MYIYIIIISIIKRKRIRVAYINLKKKNSSLKKSYTSKHICIIKFNRSRFAGSNSTNLVLRRWTTRRIPFIHYRRILIIIHKLRIVAILYSNHLLFRKSRSDACAYPRWRQTRILYLHHTKACLGFCLGGRDVCIYPEVTVTDSPPHSKCF